jgi:prophage regulatory protein
MSEIRNTISILRRPQVQERTGLSRSSLYKLIQEHKFPSQRLLGKRSVGWNSLDIDQWLEERPTKS